MSGVSNSELTVTDKERERMKEIEDNHSNGVNPYHRFSIGNSGGIERQKVVQPELSLAQKMERWLATPSRVEVLKPICSTGYIPSLCVGCGVELDSNLTTHPTIKWLRGFTFGPQRYRTETKAPFTLTTTRSYYPNYATGMACPTCSSSKERMEDKHGVSYPRVNIAPSMSSILPACLKQEDDVRIKSTLEQIKALKERNHRNKPELSLEFDPDPSRIRGLVKEWK